MDDWLRAERYAEAARLLAERGRWGWALRQLDLALSLDPERGEWHAERASALDGLERYGEAIDSYQEAIRLAGPSAGLRLCLGADLARVGRLDEAARELLEVASLEPSWVEPWIELIGVETERGDRQARDEAFYTGQQSNDASPDLYAVMALSLEDDPDTDRAALCWQEVLKRDPRHPDARTHLARCHWKAGRLHRARRFYVQQLNLDPTDTDALLELGGLLADLDRLGEAGAVLRSLIELEPGDADGHALLGEIALRQGHPDAARRRFRRVQRLDRDRPGIHTSLARAALAEGRLATAQDHARVELAREPTDSLQVIELARVLLEAELMVETIELLTPWSDDWAVFGGGRLSADAAMLLGVAHLFAGHHERGVRACRQSYRLDPTSSVPLSNLVLAFSESGRVSRARCVLRRLQNDHPGDPRLPQLRRRVRWQAWRTRMRQWMAHPLGGVARRWG